MYTTFIKIKVHRDREHSLALLAGKGPGTEQGPRGEKPRCPAWRRGCEDATKAPWVYFRSGMYLEKPRMDLSGRKWTVVCEDCSIAAVLTLLPGSGI